MLRSPSTPDRATGGEAVSIDRVGGKENPIRRRTIGSVELAILIAYGEAGASIPNEWPD